MGVKILRAPGNVTLSPIPIQLGKGYAQPGTKTEGCCPRTESGWWMVNPASGLGVLQDSRDEGGGESEPGEGE